MQAAASSEGPAKSLAAFLVGKPPLIPVLRVENADHAEPLLGALEEAGIVAIEVTLRTPAAFDVIKRMRRLATRATIGAGTLTLPEQFARVRDAGAEFAVSPALTSSLAEAAKATGLPYLPGVATPSEALRARELGFHELKFFPADLMGGPAFLRHVWPLYPDLRFCPTGGVSNGNIRTYLELENVFAAGGVYLVPGELIAAERWADLSKIARGAVAAASGAA